MPAGAPSGAAGNLLLSVGTSTATIAITSGEALTAIESAINSASTTTLGGAVSASDNGSGDLVLSSTSTTFSIGSNATATGLGLTTGAVSGTSTTRTSLQSNYNTLLTQINQLAADSGYNGVNLIGGNNLQINFNETATSSLTINGVNYNRRARPVVNQRFGGRLFLRYQHALEPGHQHQFGDLERAEPDRDVRHQFVDHLDPAIVHDQHDQHAADRRQQPGGG